MRSICITLALLALAAALPARARAQSEHPDLTGTWKIERRDSLPPERSNRGPEGGRMGGPGPRPPGGPRDSVPFGPAPTLTIAQSDSTVTIGGGRLPAHTYVTDGRERNVDVAGEETVVRARWDWGDLVIERKGGKGTTVESYRLDERTSQLIVIVEIQADEDSGDRPGTIRISRIYRLEG